jgi:shikimate dehydrogenase
MVERVGLLGWPVEHSISPAMHNAAFRALGLDWHYDLLPVPPEAFEAEVTRRIAAGYRGFNVTIPHKQAAFNLPQVTDITAATETIGAVNTLIVQPDGALHADNTDWRGFLRDLADHAFTVSGARCLVLGTGGSARGIVYALEQGGAVSVTQVSRSPTKQNGFIGYGELREVASTANLIVNCTPVGMAPHAEASPWPGDVPFPPGAALYDLIYNPPVTRLMLTAQASGAQTTNGLGMLVWQGALAFEQWTGVAPPVNVMAGAARAAIGGKRERLGCINLARPAAERDRRSASPAGGSESHRIRWV